MLEAKTAMEAFVDELLRLGENLLPSDTPNGSRELLRDGPCLKSLPVAFHHRTFRLELGLIGLWPYAQPEAACDALPRPTPRTER